MEKLISRFSGFIPMLENMENFQVAQVAVKPKKNFVSRKGVWIGIDAEAHPYTSEVLASATSYGQVLEKMFADDKCGKDLYVPVGNCLYPFKIKNLYTSEIRCSPFFEEFRNNAFEKFGVEILDFEKFYKDGMIRSGLSIRHNELGMYSHDTLEHGRERAKRDRFRNQDESQIDPAIPEKGVQSPGPLDVGTESETLEKPYPDQAAEQPDINPTNTNEDSDDKDNDVVIPVARKRKADWNPFGVEISHDVEIPDVNFRVILDMMNKHDGPDVIEPTPTLFKKLSYRSKNCTNGLMRRFYQKVTFENFDTYSDEDKHLILKILTYDLAESKLANKENRKRKRADVKFELMTLRSKKKRGDPGASEDLEEEPPESPTYEPASPSYQPVGDVEGE